MLKITQVLEKIRPIDQKLKYQIDKLLKIVNTGAAGEKRKINWPEHPRYVEC